MAGQGEVPKPLEDLLAKSREAILYSQVNLIEIQIKYRIGKLSLADAPERLIPREIARHEFERLELTDAAIRRSQVQLGSEAGWGSALRSFRSFRSFPSCTWGCCSARSAPRSSPSCTWGCCQLVVSSSPSCTCSARSQVALPLVPKLHLGMLSARSARPQVALGDAVTL